MKKIDCIFELIFVDDNSTDDSLILLEKLSKKSNEVKFIQREGPKSLSKISYRVLICQAEIL